VYPLDILLWELLRAQPSGGGRLHPVPLACGRSFDAFGWTSTLPATVEVVGGGGLRRLTALV